MRRVALICGLSGFVILVSGCGTSTPTQMALPDSHHSYPEHLVFTGQLRGALTSGVNAQSIQHAQPDPNWDFGVFKQTSCAMYTLGDDSNGGVGAGTSEWEADIYGTVSRTPVVLRLSLEDVSPPGYHEATPNSNPGSSDGEALLQLVNGQDEYTAAYGSSFTVNHDQTSGMLNISFTDTPQAPGTVTVRGRWRCA